MNQDSQPKPQSKNIIDYDNTDRGKYLDYDIDDSLEKAYDKYEKRDYVGAINLYHEILERNIRDHNSIYILASCYGYTGQADLAATYLKRAVKAGFDNLDHVDQNRAFDLVRNQPAFKNEVQALIRTNRENAHKHGQISYIDANASYRYLIKLPRDYSYDEPKKLIVGLHGRGNTPEQFMETFALYRKGNDYIHAAPCGQYPFLFHDKIGYSWNIRIAGDDRILVETTSKALSYIRSATEELRTKIKTQKTYIAGFSQGASFALMSGILDPNIVKGVISFSGWLPKDWLDHEHDAEINKAKGLRIFLAHGKSDSSIPFEYAIKTRDKLEKAGLMVTFFEFDGGHTIQQDTLDAAYDWLDNI